MKPGRSVFLLIDERDQEQGSRRGATVRNVLGSFASL